MIAKAGRLIQITEGEYSEYDVICFCVVLKDFDPEEENRLYQELYPEGDDLRNKRWTTSKFLEYLFSKGYLLEINRDKLHLGDYNTLGTDWKTHFFFTPFSDE